MAKRRILYYKPEYIVRESLRTLITNFRKSHASSAVPIADPFATGRELHRDSATAPTQKPLYVVDALEESS